MNFSIDEIDNMTTHESTSYITQYKELKSKEKEQLDKARESMRKTRLTKRGTKFSKGRR